MFIQKIYDQNGEYNKFYTKLWVICELRNAKWSFDVLKYINQAFLHKDKEVH